MSTKLLRGCFSIAFLLVCVFVGALPAAEVSGGFHDRIFHDDAGDHKYVLFVPKSYTPDKKWPVILFLHSAAERGNDGKKQAQVGLGPFVKARAATFPFVVVFPQAENVKGRRLRGWTAGTTDGRRALKILQAVEKDVSIDPNRRILTGWSMGGYGTWSIAAADPSRWAGIVPLAGGGDVATAEKLKNLPIWAFHGANDRAVPPAESQAMIDAVTSVGGKPRYTVVPNTGHDVSKVAYDTDALFAWMLNPRSGSVPLTALRARPGQRPATQASPETPFVPAVEIPQAVYLRLGNDSLKALSFSVPKQVPADMLRGRLNDMYETTTAEGRTFNVTFSGISYAGKLERASIKTVGKDRLRFQLGLRNLVMTIARTSLSGSGRSASAGTISVSIGRQRPAWLTVDVKPYIQNRKLKLKLLSSSFDIARDNFYVSSPAGVSVRGLGMTREKVSSGLVSGLYGSRGKIQQEVLALVPTIVKRLEENLELGDMTRMVSSFWPLPVYSPRVRVWPQAVSTDAKGVSLVLGVTAAAIDPAKAPKIPKQVSAAGPGISSVPQTTGLQVGVSAKMLKPLSALLIQADEARIHVLDIPNQTFAHFTNARVLAEAIPDLKQYGDDIEIWAELILVNPLALSAAEKREKIPKPDIAASKLDDDDAEKTKQEVPPETDSGADIQELLIDVPKVLISLAIKQAHDSDKWTSYAEFEYSIRQNTAAQVVHPDYTTRALRLDWLEDPDITAVGRFSPGYTPKNTKLNARLAETLFRRGWTAWTQLGPVSETTIDDIDFGSSKLRLDRIGFAAPHLFATFVPPGVKLTNSSDTPLIYETKGPHSGWGGPYTLKPGGFHEFGISHPLLFRRKIGSRLRMYTLPVGSHSEFRPPSAGGAPQVFQARG